MRVIFCKYRNKLFVGNSLVCLSWALDMASRKNQMIPVYSIRPGSPEARLIAEVDRQGIRRIHRGTYAKVHKGAKWQSL
jgi:hypothetical protein